MWTYPCLAWSKNPQLLPGTVRGERYASNTLLNKLCTCFPHQLDVFQLPMDVWISTSLQTNLLSVFFLWFSADFLLQTQFSPTTLALLMVTDWEDFAGDRWFIRIHKLTSAALSDEWWFLPYFSYLLSLFPMDRHCINSIIMMCEGCVNIPLSSWTDNKKEG